MILHGDLITSFQHIMYNNVRILYYNIFPFNYLTLRCFFKRKEIFSNLISSFNGIVLI